MSTDPVSCTVKSPVPLQIGDAVSDSFRPGVYVIDVTIPSPVNIEEISFKNYYTAFLTVRLLQKRPKSGSKWATALKKYRLMNNPHAEGGSHDYFSIYRRQMLTKPDKVSTVRLILQQPSSEWLTFSLEDIHIYPCAKKESERDLPAWFSTLTPAEKPFNLKGLPDPGSVSSSIQQMWALTEIMQASQTAASIGRFDVEGEYDVKSLSYT